MKCRCGGYYNKITKIDNDHVLNRCDTCGREFTRNTKKSRFFIRQRNHQFTDDGTKDIGTRIIGATELWKDR